MKRCAILICLLLTVNIFACDIGFFVFKAKSVMKDKSTITGYFLSDGHGNPYKANSPIQEPEVFTLKNGTNIIQYIEYDQWWYVDNYIKLPWGYYYNSDSWKEFSMTSVDSLIYLSEFEPMEIKRLAPWHSLTNQQIELLKQGIHSVETSQGALSTIVYISTRDSIGNDELELYSLERNVMGEPEKDSYHRSFFYNTPGNKKVLDSVFEDSNKGRNESILREFKFNRAKLVLLKPLIDRNLQMKPEDKLKMKAQIDSSLINIDLFITYYTDRINGKATALTQYNKLCNLYPDKTDKKNDTTASFNKSLEKALFPKLMNHYDANCPDGKYWDEIEDILAKAGIVSIECWYNSDGF